MIIDRSIYEKENYWRDGAEGTGHGEWEAYAPIHLFLRKVLGQGRLLDVGCGCGPFIQPGDPGDVYGIDFSRFAVKHPLPGAEGKLIYGEITDIPYKDNFFSIVTAFNMMEHVDPRQVPNALTELFRVSSKWVVMMTCLSTTYEPELTLDYCGEDISTFGEREQHQIQRGHWCLHDRDWWIYRVGNAGIINSQKEEEVLKFTSAFLPETDKAWTYAHRNSLMIFEKVPANV